MQFGLFYEAPEDSRHAHAERYHGRLNLTVYGETLGLDVAWDVKRAMARFADEIMPKV